MGMRLIQLCNICCSCELLHVLSLHKTSRVGGFDEEVGVEEDQGYYCLTAPKERSSHTHTHIHNIYPCFQTSLPPVMAHNHGDMGQG